MRGRRRAVGEHERRERRDRIQARRVEPQAPERRDRERADRQARDRAEAHLAHEQEPEVEHAVGRVLQPLDEADDEEHGDGVVEARLALEREREPPPQRGALQQGEHRRAVGRGEDRAEEQPLERREVEQERGGEARDRRGDGGADDGEPERRTEHRAQLLPAGRQTALEEDHREPEHADEARGVVVVEVQAADPVAAGRHPDREQDHERGQPDAPGEQRRQDAGGEQAAAEQDETGLAHATARVAATMGSTGIVTVMMIADGAGTHHGARTPCRPRGGGQSRTRPRRIA